MIMYIFSFICFSVSGSVVSQNGFSLMASSPSVDLSIILGRPLDSRKIFSWRQ